MIKGIALTALLVGCASKPTPAENPQLNLVCQGFMCPDNPLLGVGGVIYDYGGSAGNLTSANGYVELAPAMDEGDFVVQVTAMAPGDDDLLLIDNDEVALEASVQIAELTELRLEAPGIEGPLATEIYDASYNVAAGVAVELEFFPQIEGQVSSGTHFYDVAFDNVALGARGRPVRAHSSRKA